MCGGLWHCMPLGRDKVLLQGRAGGQYATAGDDFVGDVIF